MCAFVGMKHELQSRMTKTSVFCLHFDSNTESYFTVTVRRSQLKTDQLLAMDTSVKLNGLVREHSSDAALVMMNMPPPVTPYVDSITGEPFI